MFNWGCFYATKNVDECWSIRYNQILTNANFYAPFCNKSLRSSQPDWFWTEILDKSIERDRLYSIAKRTKNNSDFERAKAKRNEVKTDIENARSTYFLDKLKKHSGDPKRIWGEIGNLISTSNFKMIYNVYDSFTGQLADTDRSADLIKQFFAVVGLKLDGDLPKAPFTNIVRDLDLEFDCCYHVGVPLVSELIRSIDLSKSSSCDLISSRLYKDALNTHRNQWRIQGGG